MNDCIDPNAAIAATKIGTRTLYLSFPPYLWCLSGTSVVVSADGICPVVLFPDANTGIMYITTRLPTEWVSADVTFTILWKTTAITGNAKFTVDIGVKGAGGDTSSTTSGTVTTAAETTANKIQKSQVTIAAAIFNNDWLGIKLSRDPADGADTLATNLYIVGFYVEFTGRA
jgi:hypothetical protein